jgi:hypothetical protein
MRTQATALALLVLLLPPVVLAGEAPPNVKVFNRTCPAKRLLPQLETAQAACQRGNPVECDRFVDTFQKLLPEYDCQRPFDATPTANYIVPAIWLAGPALEEHIRFLSTLQTQQARRLFGSPEFRAVLDGYLASEFQPLSLDVEQELRRK